MHKLKSATPNLRVINLYGINFVDDSHIDAFSSNCIQVKLLILLILICRFLLNVLYFTWVICLGIYLVRNNGIIREHVRLFRVPPGIRLFVLECDENCSAVSVGMSSGELLQQSNRFYNENSIPAFTKTHLSAYERMQ